MVNTYTSAQPGPGTSYEDYQAAPADNEITNPGMGEQGELFLRLKRWFISARDHSNEWRKQAEEDYAFVASDQWSQEDQQTLKEQMRPALTINRVGTVIDSVAGLEVQNRQEIRAIPRQLGNVGVAELETAAFKWFRDQSRAEDEESDAFRDSVICGIGCIDTRLDYTDDPEGTSVDERIDPLEMYWDPVAKKRNLEDRRYTFRLKKMPQAEAQELFPDADVGVLHAAWADEHPDADVPHDALAAKFYRNDQSGRDAGDPIKKVLIIQAQWWDREDFYRVADPKTGKIIHLPPDRYRVLAAQFNKIGGKLQAVKSQRKVFKQAFLGAEVLEAGSCPCPEHFTMNFITGKRDRNKNMFYGLVRQMKDPQRWANKFFSSLIHQFSTSGKGVFVETDAVTNPRRFEEDYARADAIKWMKPGALGGGKVQQINGAQMNAGVMQMMEFAVTSIRDATGVNVELIGTAEKDQPGILEYQRKMAGMTVLADFFDGLRRFRKVQGHILLYYIRNFFSDGRLIKIDGETGAQYIPLIRDPNVEEYDIIVDDAPASPNQKEHTWLLITQLMPVLQNAAPRVIGALLKYSPLPESLVNELNQLIQQQSQQPNPKIQIEAMRAQADIESKRAGAIANLAKAGIQGPGVGEELLKSAADALLTSGQSAQDHQEQMQQNQQQHAHDMQQLALEHAHQAYLAAQQQAHERNVAAAQPKPI